MKITNSLIHPAGVILFIFLVFTPLSCVFSPNSGKKVKNDQPGVFVEPTTYSKVISNLQVAFARRDIDFYDRCLHENYFYISPSDVDELDLYWSRSEELEVMRNLMNGCREIVFTHSRINIYEEYGKNVPNKPDGAMIDSDDEHPDEIWYVGNYYITIDIFTNDFGDFKVQQDMQFIMVEDSETHLFSIIRWIDNNQITQ